jgi:hypothetical protein
MYAIVKFLSNTFQLATTSHRPCTPLNVKVKYLKLIYILDVVAMYREAKGDYYCAPVIARSDPPHGIAGRRYLLPINGDLLLYFHYDACR